MAKYEKTGYLVDPLNPGTRQPQFGDFTALPDYMTAQNIIKEGRDAFESLPARVRKMFDNDPALYLDFIGDSNNIDQALELGLVDEHYASVVKAQIEAQKPVKKTTKKAAEPALEPEQDEA